MSLVFDLINQVFVARIAGFHWIERELFVHLAPEKMRRCWSQRETGIQTGWGTRYRWRKIIMFAVPRPANYQST
jgi:hypothetical protein